MKTVIKILCVLAVVASVCFTAIIASHRLRAGTNPAATLQQQGFPQANFESSEVAFQDTPRPVHYPQPAPRTHSSRTKPFPQVGPGQAAFAPIQQSAFAPAPTVQQLPSPQIGFVNSAPVMHKPAFFPSPGPVQSNPIQPPIVKATTFNRPIVGNRYPPTQTARLPSAQPAAWPPNARNVKNLVRTQYSLPSGAADSIVKFFAADENESIETKIQPDEQSELVSLQVTTDEKTQRAIAAFLAAVYPTTRLDEIQNASADEGRDLPADVQFKDPLVVPDAIIREASEEVQPPDEANALPVISSTEIK